MQTQKLPRLVWYQLTNRHHDLHDNLRGWRVGMVRGDVLGYSAHVLHWPQGTWEQVSTEHLELIEAKHLVETLVRIDAP